MTDAELPELFGCNFFQPWDLSAHNYTSIEEEMFITPVCLNSKAKLAIYLVYDVLFFLCALAGCVLLFGTWRKDEGWKLARFIKIFVVLTPLGRALGLVTIFANDHSVLRYFLYALPIALLMLTISLVVAQWFLLTIKLSFFVKNINIADHFVKQLLVSFVIFNICFSVGDFGFFIAAGVIRNSGGLYRTHNILMGAGFAWQGLCTIIFGLLIIAVGNRLSSLLLGNGVGNEKVNAVARKIRWFSFGIAFLAVNVGIGSFVATIWMAATLDTPYGMSGFFYLLAFVFLTSEVLCPVAIWWLVLKGSKGAKGTSEGSDSSPGKLTEQKNTSKTQLPEVQSSSTNLTEHY